MKNIIEALQNFTLDELKTPSTGSAIKIAQFLNDFIATILALYNLRLDNELHSKHYPQWVENKLTSVLEETIKNDEKNEIVLWTQENVDKITLLADWFYKNYEHKILANLTKYFVNDYLNKFQKIINNEIIKKAELQKECLGIIATDLYETQVRLTATNHPSSGLYKVQYKQIKDALTEFTKNPTSKNQAALQEQLLKALEIQTQNISINLANICQTLTNRMYSPTSKNNEDAVILAECKESLEKYNKKSELLVTDIINKRKSLHQLTKQYIEIKNNSHKAIKEIDEKITQKIKNAEWWTTVTDILLILIVVPTGGTSLIGLSYFGLFGNKCSCAQPSTLETTKELVEKFTQVSLIAPG